MAAIYRKHPLFIPFPPGFCILKHFLLIPCLPPFSSLSGQSTRQNGHLPHGSDFIRHRLTNGRVRAGNCPYPRTKSMFQTLKRTFQTMKYTFQTVKHTFQSLKHRICAGTTDFFAFRPMKCDLNGRGPATTQNEPASHPLPAWERRARPAVQSMVNRCLAHG